MARRVNTKFVITLGAALAAIAGAGTVYVGMEWMHNRDPIYLQKEADAAMKAGQMPEALVFMERASARAVGKHMNGAEDLCMKTADLALKLSAEEKDPAKAQELYRTAFGEWQAALSSNPRYLPARKRLAEEGYAITKESANAANLLSLQNNADKLVELAPDYANGYFYSAVAHLQLMQIGASGDTSPDDTLQKVQQELTKALTLAPGNGEAAATLGAVEFGQGQRAASRGMKETAQKLQKQSIDSLTEFLKKYPNDPNVAGQLFIELEVTNRGPEGLKVLEAAYAAHPDNVQLLARLATAYRASDPAKAEKLCKDFIASHPNQPEAYFALTDVYKSEGKAKEAIATYRDLLNADISGGGLAAFERTAREATAYRWMSWLYMDLAEKDGPTSEAGQADLKQADIYAGRFRTANPNAGVQNELDGRLQLIRQNVGQAIAYLKRADANLGGDNPMPGADNEWLQTKMLLARAYEMRQEWGAALGYINQVRIHYPQQVSPMLQQMNLLNRIGRYSESLALAEPILALKQLPNNLREQVLREKAASLYGMGNRQEADQIISSLDSTQAALMLAATDIQQGKDEEALDALNRVFEKDPNNVTALTWAIHVNTMLDRKADAEKLVDRALAKYPNNANFQVIKAALARPNSNTLQAQKDILQSITDDYSRAMAFAQLYRRMDDPVNELASLQTAEKALDGKHDAAPAAMAYLVEQSFDLVTQMAANATAADQKQKYWDLARTYVQKAQRLNLDGENGSIFQAELSYRQGDKKAGQQTLEQVVGDHPDDSQARRVLGQMYAQSGQLDQALDQLRAAIKAKPDDVQALKLIIATLLQKGDSAAIEEAKVDFKQAKIFAPRDPQVLAFADTLGDPAESMRTREQIYKSNPNDLDNVERLAVLYVQNRQIDKAIALLKPIYKQHPDDLVLADKLAHLYRDTQQVNEALTMYERFLASKDPTVRYNATLLLGEQYYSLGRIDEAARAYKEAISLEPAGNDQAERRLADLYFDADNTAEAEATYQKIYDKAKNKDMTVLRRIVECQIREHKYAEADKNLNDIIFKADPNDAEGLVLKGSALMQQGKSQEALATFSQVLAKDPNNINALHYRALLQYTMPGGNLEQAAKDLIAVRDRNKAAIPSRLLLARVFRLLHRLTEAASEYTDVIALRPDLVSARLEYARFLLDLAKVQQHLSPNNTDDVAYMIRKMDPTSTLQQFLADSEKRFPNVAMWQLMEGDLLSLTGRTQDAQKTYAEAYKRSNQNPIAASAYMDSLLKTGNYEEAIDLAKRMTTASPNDVDAYVKRGTAYAATGKISQASDDFSHAMDLAAGNAQLALAVSREMMGALPADKVSELMQAKMSAHADDIGFRLAFAQVLLLSNHASEAAHTIEPLKNDPKAKDIQPVVLRILALAEYQAKEISAACQDYQQLLKLVPNDVESLNNLSFMLAEDMHHPEQALPYAQEAMKVLQTGDASMSFINNGNVYDTLGWVELLAGDADKAVRDLQHSIQLEPSPIAYYHLAKAYLKQNRKSDAVKAVQDGLQLAAGQKLGGTEQLKSLQAELGK